MYYKYYFIMKKIFTALFIISLLVSPSVSNAGFFDFLRINQTAQIKNVSTINSNIVGYRKGDRADVITQVQKALFDKGLYKGDISGLIGPKTEASIRAWQQANRLSVTGILDAETINSILGRFEDGNRGGGNPNSTTAQANCAPGDMPWIKVKNPNGGETYVAGSNIKVQWESCNVPPGIDIGIDLLNQISTVPVQNINHVLVEQTGNDGIEQVTLNPQAGMPTFELGNNFKILIHYVVTNDYDYNTYGVNPPWMQLDDKSDNLFSIVDQLGGGNCDPDNVEIDILPLTTQMSQIDDLPVLEFRIDNQTNCQVALEDMKFIYMTTDTLPYFEDIILVNKNTNMVVAEGTINGSISGESLWVSFIATNGYMIDENDEDIFVLYLQSYEQPTQGSLESSDYKNKNLIFGVPNIDQIDFKFWENGVQIPYSESWNLGSNLWGSIVRLPASAL